MDLPTDEDHRPAAGLGALLGDRLDAGVALLLCADGPSDRRLESSLAVGLAHRRPQEGEQVGLRRREEAGLEITVGRHAQAIARPTKVLGLPVERVVSASADERRGRHKKRESSAPWT